MTGNKAKAVIWDMDGVIVDTARYHLKAWQEAFQKKGVDFTEAAFRESFGQRNDTIIGKVLGQAVSPEEMKAMSEEKEACFRRLVRQEIKALPGVLGLMKSLANHGYCLALASSSPLENIRLLTESLGIRGLFQAVVSGEDVTEGKPSPQVFLLAAERLGVKPEDCVVVEDAVAGVAACRSANMRCLAVTNTHPRASLAAADLIVDNLAGVNVTDLEQLLQLPQP